MTTIQINITSISNGMVDSKCGFGEQMVAGSNPIGAIGGVSRVA